MANILDKIVATKRQEIRAAQDQLSLEQLRERLPDAPPRRDFFAALAEDGPIRLIAEVKKASPSQGTIREDFDPVQIAKTYQENGATCISVLTDVQYFQGAFAYLSQIRQATSIPLLCKDFILDTYQLVQARVAGADAVLLIAECLDDCNLRMLHNAALDLGLTPLVEFYRRDNLSRVLEAGATLVGVNNRDLTTFETDLSHTVSIRDQIPKSCLLVSESGVRGRDDVVYLEQAGVDAILVGEHLMRQQDIGAAVRDFLGTSNPLKSNSKS